MARSSTITKKTGPKVQKQKAVSTKNAASTKKVAVKKAKVVTPHPIVEEKSKTSMPVASPTTTKKSKKVATKKTTTKAAVTPKRVASASPGKNKTKGVKRTGKKTGKKAKRAVKKQK